MYIDVGMRWLLGGVGVALGARARQKNTRPFRQRLWFVVRLTLTVRLSATAHRLALIPLPLPTVV